MDKTFTPKPVELTQHGRMLVDYSENFKAAKQIYMLEPPNESGKVKIGTDKNGSVFAYISKLDVIGLED